jgi:ABC-type multidrug transport system fused ATPase/permease subunit
MGEKEGSVVNEGDRSVSIANGGPVSRRSSSAAQSSGRRASKARSSAVRPADTGMVFQDVCVDAEDKRILWDISGKAVPGQMLALMGPSGAGKTTLLNALAGHTPITSGKILLNSKKMSKKMKRKISYVQQADIFFPNLTLRETLRMSQLHVWGTHPGNQDIPLANWDILQATQHTLSATQDTSPVIQDTSPANQDTTSHSGLVS